MINKLKKDLYQYYPIIIIIILYIVFMKLLFSEICPIKLLFHVDCPGCGIIHASQYLIKRQFKKAIEANYTVFFWYLFIFLFIIDRYVHKLKIKVFPDVFIAICIITLIRYIANILI